MGMTPLYRSDLPTHRFLYTTMADEDRTLMLTCSCGTARTEVTLPESMFPITAAFCHCNSCRHVSGCLCFTRIPLPSEIHYQPDDELLTKLTAFKFSKVKIYHYFWTIYGTHMPAHVYHREQTEFEGRWFATCGAIKNVERVYQSRHEYAADTLDSGFADLLILLNRNAIDR
jgi:hypothetical protein